MVSLRVRFTKLGPQNKAKQGSCCVWIKLMITSDAGDGSNDATVTHKSSFELPSLGNSVACWWLWVDSVCDGPTLRADSEADFPAKKWLPAIAWTELSLSAESSCRWWWIGGKTYLDVVTVEKSSSNSEIRSPEQVFDDDVVGTRESNFLAVFWANKFLLLAASSKVKGPHPPKTISSTSPCLPEIRIFD